jgi:hypothetical protein
MWPPKSAPLLGEVSSSPDNPMNASDASQMKMNMPKFFELIGSCKEGETDPSFRVFVELTDKDQGFWESQSRGTPEGRDQMNALRNGLMEVLPSGTKLSPAPVATFFEGDAKSIIAKAEPVIAKDGRRAWIVKDRQ